MMQQLLAADLGLTPEHFGSHATDLYVVALPGVREWLKENHKFFSNVTMFQSPADSQWLGAGKMCFDIPFAGNWPTDPHKKKDTDK
jgi:hypothetical protein